MVNMNVTEIAQYCCKKFPEACKKLIDEAEQIMNLDFWFTDTWDMEKESQKVHFDEKINWEYFPKSDKEWTYMLNRHSHLYKLAKAYVLTLNNKFLDSFIAQIKSWILNCKHIQQAEKTTWRSIDTAIRIQFWCKSLWLFESIGDQIIDEDTNILIKNSLEEQIIYLYKAYVKQTNKHLISNWGILETHGLFCACLYLEETNAKYHGYVDTLLDRLYQMINIQILPDGVHWEQSPLYHNTVLRALLDVITLAKEKNVLLNKEFTKKVRLMGKVNMAWVKPNGYQLSQGDSDTVSIKDINTYYSVLFNDGAVKNASYDQIDFNTIWSVGHTQIQKYEALQTIDISACSYALQDSGNYYLRSDWTPSSTFVHFKCGRIGSGHGHADLLHIDLFGGGEDILIDPGRYTYENNIERLSLKSQFLHNTICVDNLQSTVCKNTWEYAKIAEYIPCSFRFSKKVDFIQGTNLGYLHTASGGVLIKRNIVFLKPKTLIVIDQLYSDGTHTYTQFWNINPSLNIEKTGSANTLLFKGFLTTCLMQTLEENVKTQISETIYSPSYGTLTKGKVVTVSLNAHGFSSLCTVFEILDPPHLIDQIDFYRTTAYNFKNIELTKEQATAFCLIANGKKYSILFRHKDDYYTTLTSIDKFKEYGSVLIWENNNLIFKLA